MKYSSAELTAVDLVQFAKHVGGYQRAATVLAELVASVSIYKIRDVLPFTSTATIQRMGYLLEFILEEREMADELFDLMRQDGKKMNIIVMRNDVERRKDCPQNRWHVNMNIGIEIDDI